MSSLPPTTRIGGGASARGTALVAALALAVVAGLAAAGQSPEPPPQPTTARPAAALATPAPTLTLTPHVATATPRAAPATPFVLPTPESGAWGNLVVVLALGPKRHVTFLREDLAGTLRATLEGSFPRPAQEGMLELVELSTIEGQQLFMTLASFRLPLDPLVPETRRRGKVLDRVIAAHPELPATALVRRGYRIRVVAESRQDHFRLLITINVGPVPDHFGG